MSDISAKLQKLGFIKAASLPSVKPRITKSLADILGARELSSQFGDVLFFEDLYAYGSFHGEVLISPESNFQELNKLVKLNAVETGVHNHLFIDTETTGLSGGTGTIPFLIGFGFFDQSGFRIGQLILENPINEPAQLIEFTKIVNNYENTITFNGKSFDLPLIRTRFALNKIPDPLEHFSHIDLLHLSRKIWKSRLADRSLQELEKHILHYFRSSEEVPGWMIPQIYFDFLKSGDGTLLKNVSYHNAIDIVSMAALYIKINLMLNDTIDRQHIDIFDLFAIGMMYEQIDEVDQALYIYNTCFASKKINNFDQRNLCNRMAVIYKRKENWNEATFYWQIGARLGDLEACVSLAKYHEHNRKNNREALEWVDRAESILLTHPVPAFRQKRLSRELSLRKQRLQRSDKNV